MDEDVINHGNSFGDNIVDVINDNMDANNHCHHHHCCKYPQQ